MLKVPDCIKYLWRCFKLGVKYSTKHFQNIDTVSTALYSVLWKRSYCEYDESTGILVLQSLQYTRSMPSTQHIAVTYYITLRFPIAIFLARSLVPGNLWRPLIHGIELSAHKHCQTS